MGANQSYESDFCDVISAAQNGERKDRRYVDGDLQNKRRKAKPASPHRPTVTAVTHNAVSLTWLPPRHTLNAIIAYTVEIRKPRQAKHWHILTKNCQGTHYQARHLDTDTEYIFRVRAENIFGTGKPSVPSDIITTKIFENTSDLNCYISPSSPLTPISPVSPFSERGFPKSISYDSGLLDAPDGVFVNNGDSSMVKSPSMPVGSSSTSFASGSLSCSGLSLNQYGSLKRRHSFNVQLDGRVSTMLNHSDRFCSTNSINSSTSTIVVNNNVGSSNDVSNNDTDSVKRKTSSILRNNLHRTSFQLGRKTTIPILLPGAGSNSLDRLKESRVSLKSSSGDIIGSQSTLPRQRGSVNKNRKSRESRSSLGSTASDSNTNTSSTNSSKEDGKTCQGSRLSLQSVLSDVTMSNNSQSSDEPSSRPTSFSDSGENTELGSFLNYDSKELNRIIQEGQFQTDNEKKTMKNNNSYNNCVNDDEEDIYRLKQDLKNMEITEEKLKYHDLKERLKIDFSDESCLNNNLDPQDYYQSLDNPWQKVTNSVNSVSENIMAAPFSDDIKIALNAKNNSHDVTANAYRATNQNWGIGEAHERDDFRTLRSVLQSNHMIVKQSRSMPEVVGVVYGDGGETRTLTRGKLTTIEDADEEEEAVRVTTL